VPLLTATAPGTWGVEPGGSPLDPPWARVLDEIAVSGFDGSELGPLGYYPEQPAWLRHELDVRALRLAGGFVMEPLHDPRELPRVLDLTRRTCAALAGGGAAVLVVIDGLFPARSATAGRDDAAVRLPAPAWAQLVATVEQIATIAAEFGLTAAFHPHAGTHVEFADEIERLLAETDPSLVGLCLDTGHACYAGIDPLTLIADHGERIRHVHLKDVDGAALAQALARRSSFEQAVADGVFCPLGTGDVDLAAVAEALAQIGFDGWAVFEQDRAPGAPGAQAEATASLRHLRRLGIARTVRPVADAR
jgi:inosose dehydratase